MRSSDWAINNFPAQLKFGFAGDATLAANQPVYVSVKNNCFKRRGLGYINIDGEQNLALITEVH